MNKKSTRRSKGEKMNIYKDYGEKQVLDIRKQLTNLRTWLHENVGKQLGSDTEKGYFQYKISSDICNEDGHRLRVRYSFNINVRASVASLDRAYPPEYKKLEALSTRVSGKKYGNNEVYFSSDHQIPYLKMHIEIVIDITVPNAILPVYLIERHAELVGLAKESSQLWSVFSDHQLNNRNLQFRDFFLERHASLWADMAKSTNKIGGLDGLDRSFTSLFANIITFLGGDPNPHVRFASYYDGCHKLWV